MEPVVDARLSIEDTETQTKQSLAFKVQAMKDTFPLALCMGALG